MSFAQWIRLVTLTGALWGIVYLFHVVIHEDSFELIEDIAVMLACLLSFGLLFGIYQGLFGRNERSPRTDYAAPTRPEPISVLAPAPLATELPPAEQVARAVSQVNGYLGVGVAVALFGYFPVTRYFHVLTTALFWSLVAGISIVSSTAFGFYVTRRLSTGFKNRAALQGIIIAGVLVIFACTATLIRLVNATLGLFADPAVRRAQITDAQVTRPKRHTFPTYTVDLALEDGDTVSLDISCSTYYSLGVGDKVEVQAQLGLLAMPWCFGDCVSHGSRQAPPYANCK